MIEAVSEEDKSTSFMVKIPYWDEDFDGNQCFQKNNEASKFIQA
jgi:hypothetical protein